MKHIKITIVSLLVICFSFANAQEKPITELKLKTRYKDGAVEMRFFPNNKKTMKTGLEKGYILHRAEGNGAFKEIDKIIPYTQEQWQKSIVSAKNEDERIDFEIGQDFQESIIEDAGGEFNFEKGIAELKEQKSAEDFQLMVSILTAIKSPITAKGLGLSYTDTSVEKGKTYRYKISLVGEVPVYEVKSVEDTVKTIESKEEYQNKVYTKEGDTELSFVWIEDDKLSGYDVERQDVSGKFVKLNKAPIYSLLGANAKERRSSFSDEGLTNYKKYRYRFFGNTVFGERIQFAEVEAMPRDLTPPQKPFLKQPKHIKPDEVLVEWEMLKEIESDLKGFAISRSEDNRGKFQLIYDKLLPKNARRFIDKSFIKGKTNYYLVQAIDTADNVSSSFPVAVTLIDSVPPKRPAFISGKMDSLGIVTIDIKKNKEEDLMGYRLYRANGENHEFSVIYEGFLSLDDRETGKVQTIFKDTVTLKSLTPYVYYKTEALDFNHNTSKQSEILKVKRPDTIPPTTPVFKKIKVHSDAVELTFILSKSKDVKEHFLYRKTDIKAPWTLLATLKNEEKNYTDKKLEKGQKYYYTLRAKDESNNYSKYAVPIMGKPYDNGVRPPVEKIDLKFEKNNVLLTWEYPQRNKDTFFVIYKTNSKGNLVQYKNTKELNFKEVAKKGTTYAIKVFTKDGGQSKISEKVVVNYK